MFRRKQAYDVQLTRDLLYHGKLDDLTMLQQFHLPYPLDQHGINHLLLGYFQYSHKMLIYLEFVTMLDFQINLHLQKFQPDVQFLVGSNHYPIDNELDQIIQLELLLHHTTLYQTLQMLQRKRLQYYLIKQFQYYPYVKHGIIVEEDEPLNGKFQQKYRKYQRQYDEQRYHPD